MPFLKEIRKELGLTQEEAGSLTGISQAGYSKQELEAGPSTATIEVLTSVGVSVDYLLRGTGSIWVQGFTRPLIHRRGGKLTLEAVKTGETAPQPEALGEVDAEAYLAAERAVDAIAPELKKVPEERAELIVFVADHFAYLRSKNRTHAFEARIRRLLEIGRTLSRKPK